jgi:hypothetical protein
MSGETFLPWWQCSALILDGHDEIDADIEVRASTAGEAEDIARAEWADLGLGADAVTVRRCDQ